PAALRRLLVRRTGPDADRGRSDPVRGLPDRPRGEPAADPQRTARDLLRRYRLVRVRRLRRAPHLVRTRRVARLLAGRTVPAAPDRQPAGHAPARPARSRLGEPGIEDPWTR